MNIVARIIAAAAAASLLAGAAFAQPGARARENAAGGVSAGAVRDAYGPYGGRVLAEGGVVTNGDGAGFGGSRGCARDAVGSTGCRASSTFWNEDGAFTHESGGVYNGAFGGAGAAYGTLTRDSDGDVYGARNGAFSIGDRTYTAETTFESGEGLSRDVNCSGSGCR